MPLSKNLNTYNDVLQVLTTARKHGGATYELKSAGAATNWCARAYYFRTLLTKAAIARAGLVKGFIPSTDWDDMLLTREGAKVNIAFGRLAGTLTDADGNALSLVIPQVDRGAAEDIIAQIAPPSINIENADLLDDLELTAIQLLKEKGA